MVIAQHLTVDQIAVILACLEDVQITDAVNVQNETKAQLCRALKRAAPQHFLELVGAGKFTDNSKRMPNKSQHIAQE